MSKTIYNYDPQTLAFIGESHADESPLEPGVFLVPAFATFVQPPAATKPREVAVFVAGAWQLVCDWRGVPLYDTSTGRVGEILVPGIAPTDIGATDQPMPGAAYSWVDGAWAIDSEKVGAQPPPAIVSMRQARLALLGLGKLEGVAAAIATLPSPTREAAQIEWEYSATVERGSPTVAMLGQALALDEAALDALFVTAATL